MSALIFDQEAATWPNANASQFIEAGELKFHVQVMGKGPAMLLVHGTGASTHSWRDFAPLLAEKFTVVMPDLPGHGFTSAPSSHRLSLPAMAQAVTALVTAMGISPVIAAGHSAGAAVLCRMVLDGKLSPAALVSLNGALLPFRGVASHVFPVLARFLFANPIMPAILSWRGHDQATVRGLIEGTGSTIDAQGLKLYGRLFQSSSHVASALNMMAHWDLHALARDLPALPPILTLVAATGDLAVPPEVAYRVKAMLPSAHVSVVRGLGHLAHEEAPQTIAQEVMAAACRVGVLEAQEHDPEKWKPVFG